MIPAVIFLSLLLCTLVGYWLGVKHGESGLVDLEKEIKENGRKMDEIMDAIGGEPTQEK